MTSQKPQRRLRAVHKRIALHASSLLLLLGGSFLPMPVSFAQTYTLDVTARVPATLPADPAVITNPQDQQHFTTQEITVTGTCPDNSYVKIFVGETLAATALCTGGNFTATVTLQPGANTLTAKVYNSTDDEGPASPPITVYYDPPTPPVTPSPGTAPTTPATGGAVGSGTPPLIIDTPPYGFTIRQPGETWSWEINVGGGTPPYTIIIEWGDGTSDRITRTTAGPFTISHVYKKAGTYQPLIQVTDANGLLTTLQLLAEVREKPIPAIQFIQSYMSNMSPWVAWPLYISIALAICGFWAFELAALYRYLQTHKIKRNHAS